MSKIRERFEIDGALTDVTSCKLSDPTGTYGVKRNDNDAVVVADDTAMTKVATGIYEYEFTDPAYDLEYTYYVEWVYDGETHHDEFTKDGPVSAAACPLTLAEIKLHLKVDFSDDDALITQLMLAATSWAENFQNRTYINRSRTQVLDSFPDVIRPPYPPLVSIDSITYIDTAGATQTLSSSVYDVDTTNEPGRVVPAYGQTWPSIRSDINAVTVTYTAGYGAAEDVPDPAKAAIKLLVDHLYTHRGGVSEIPTNEVPLGIRDLLWPERCL